MEASARSLPPVAADDTVQAVRRFNRFYTRRIGVLQEHLLQSQLSLTEVRVLYELAQRDDMTAVELRQALGLDRGYLSRMLGSFEKQGWIRTAPSPDDRRRILLSLTARGAKVFAPLDQRSSEEVSAMLVKLSPREQKDLVAGMRDIERILHPAPDSTAPSYVLRQHRPGDMGWIVHRQALLFGQEYGYGGGFEALVAEIVAKFIQSFDSQRERCWIAERGGEVVGSIFLVRKSNPVAQLRLLFVEPSVRGLGIGKRLVSECVSFARQVGYKRIVLWTQSELDAARHLYEQAGFQRIAQEPHRSWGKALVAETWELRL